MRTRQGILLPAILFAVLASYGCARFGQVNQGQVVAFDRQSGQVTLISDTNYADPANPRFDALPPLTVRIPQDPNDMGPEPQTGWLLGLDAKAATAAVFDPGSRSIRTIPVSIVEDRAGVAADSALVHGKSFPAIDRGSNTITVYSPGLRRLVKFTVAAEHLSLPEEAWRVGDQVRYYYKEPDQALRLMNVSKTDLSPSK